MDSPTSNGKLIATVLSAYDLPDDDVPTSVTMSYMESNGRGGFNRISNEVSTGPPAAKHRDHANSFKFGGVSSANNNSSSSSSNNNGQMILSAPLPVLFESTVSFKLTYANSSKNLVSKCTLNKTLRVNDTQWLILNLNPESPRNNDNNNNANNNNNTSKSPERVYKSSASRISNYNSSNTSTSSLDNQPPTLRLKLRLDGPYRPEIAASINLANSWFTAIDVISDTAVGTASHVGLTGSSVGDLRNVPLVKMMLVPCVPMATVAVAFLPIIGGTFRIFYFFACAIKKNNCALFLLCSVELTIDIVCLQYLSANLFHQHFNENLCSHDSFSMCRYMSALCSITIPFQPSDSKGVLIIGIPFVLPILVLLLSIALGLTAIGSTFYFSTREGRTKLNHLLDPMYQTFLMTNTAQKIIYDVGPRPSPQSIAKAVLPTDMIGKLITSLVVDFIGSASYLLPLLGEAFDLTWAPMSMVFVGAMYDDVMPNLKYVALVEELLPLTDWIPSAMLGWLKEFGPGIFEEVRRRMGGAKNVARREGDALVNMRR